MKAEKVKSIGYVGYNYLIRQGSIMTDSSKTKKKAYDFLFHYKKLVNALDNIDLNNKNIYKSFLANSVIIKSLELNKTDYKKYIKELKKLRVFDNLLSDSLAYKVKKCVLVLVLNFIIR